MLAEKTLQDKVAIITGGGTGIGFAIAEEYARLGCRVVLASRSAEHLDTAVERLKEQGGRALALQTDVRDSDQVKSMVAKTVEEWGGVDILVNNAAGNFICPSEKLPAKGWKAVVEIVLNGTFFCSRSVGRWMIENNHPGSIVNIVATYAWTGCPGVVHSASAKAGVVAMTRTLAVEWARHNIRVNAIAPGPVETEGASQQLWANPKARAALEATIPLRRFGSKEDVARAAAYLASAYADVITGEVMVMDGGQWLGGTSYFAALADMFAAGEK